MSNPLSKVALSARSSSYNINNIFLSRWSPRVMSGEKITHEELLALFEAAHWAPSAYNNQPWRFLYAKKGSKYWDLFFKLLVPFNQSWCEKADALVLIVSKKNFEKNGKPSRTHAFDTGAAWMSLALEGAFRGLVVHGMEGFDYESAQKNLNIPGDHEVLAMAAIGKLMPRDQLTPEQKEKETPSQRRPLTEILHEGPY